MSRRRSINKSLRLMHINNLLKITIYEGIINVHLLNLPTPCHDKSENNPNGRGLDHRTKCFIEIHAELLLKPLGNKPSLVLIKGTINFIFNLQNPLALDNTLFKRRGNYVLSVVLHESMKLVRHGKMPLRINKSFRDRGWFST